MSTQQDIYVVGSENRPPMLNKDNYVPWSSPHLRYAKCKPNRKLIYNSIMNGPYNDEELTEKEVKQMEADDQAIKTILMGFLEDIYAAVDSCETAQEIWLRLPLRWGIDDLNYPASPRLMTDFKKKQTIFLKRCQQSQVLNNLQQEWSRHVTIVHQTKDLHIADYTQLYDFLKYNQVEVVQNAVQNLGVQNVGNQNGLIVVLGIANPNANQDGNGNVVVARDEVRPRKRDVAYLQTQLLIAQKEESGIQLQAEEFDFMADIGDLDEIEEVNANCILMANLQQTSTSSTQIDKALVYDSDGSAENDNNVIFVVSSVEQSGRTIEQHYATIEETHAYFESIYNNLAIEAEKVNTINRKMKETNADLTTQLARYKNQEKCFEFNQEKYEKLERCYQKSIYQEQCLTKKINALHLSSDKTITTLNEEITNLNNQLSKEKSNVSSLQEEKKKLKSDFKIRKEKLLDKQIHLENKIKELDNILVKIGQSIQTMHMLSPKPDLVLPH
ncbi:hypothetical protein Tco_1023060 [Tanacetum coccineum]